MVKAASNTPNERRGTHPYQNGSRMNAHEHVPQQSGGRGRRAHAGILCNDKYYIMINDTCVSRLEYIICVRKLTRWPGPVDARGWVRRVIVT